MAERWAIGTGNWSDVTKWDGGTTLPGAGDTVHANGFTITINQDITVGSIRTTAGTTPVAGGGFTANGTRSLTCDIVSGTTTVLTCGASTTTTINGNVTGGSSTNARGVLTDNATGAVTINGNCTGGSGTTAVGALSSSTGTLTVNGIAIPSTVSSGVSSTSTGVTKVNGYEFASNGLIGIDGTVYVNTSSSATVKVYESGGTTLTLDTPRKWLNIFRKNSLITR